MRTERRGGWGKGGKEEERLGGKKRKEGEEDRT